MYNKRLKMVKTTTVDTVASVSFERPILRIFCSHSNLGRKDKITQSKMIENRFRAEDLRNYWKISKINGIIELSCENL
jgi:hypothetical protein